MRLLLDTCTFLWIAQDPDKLSQRARAEFDDTENEIFLSAASVWEMTIKHMTGKLPVEHSPAKHIEAMRANGDIAQLPISFDDALHVSKLPQLHRDPFDRLLVAQAIVQDLTILTPDPLIHAYPARVLW